MRGGDAPGARQADVVSLPTIDPDTRFPGILIPLPAREGTRAVLDLPTGMLIVASGTANVHGSIDDMERLAADLIAACWEAGKQSPNPPGTRRAYQGEGQ
jgi:hypothetical protein